MNKQLFHNASVCRYWNKLSTVVIPKSILYITTRDGDTGSRLGARATKSSHWQSCRYYLFRRLLQKQTDALCNSSMLATPLPIYHPKEITNRKKNRPWFKKGPEKRALVDDLFSLGKCESQETTLPSRLFILKKWNLITSHSFPCTGKEMSFEANSLKIAGPSKQEFSFYRNHSSLGFHCGVLVLIEKQAAIPGPLSLSPLQITYFSSPS